MGQSTNFQGFALNTVAAAGADAVLDNGLLTLTGVPNPIAYGSILNPIGVKFNASVAGIARSQQATVIVPPAVGTSYQIYFTQPQPDGGTSKQFVAITSVTGDTAITVATTLETAINGLIDAGLLLGTVTRANAVLTIAGTVAAPMLRITGVSSSLITLAAASPSGTNPVNQGPQVVAQDVQNALPTNTYSTFEFQFSGDNSGETSQIAPNRNLIYAIAEGTANANTLIDKLKTIFQGILAGSSPATTNPENVGVLS